MTKEIKLNALARAKKEKSKKGDEYIPAVVYGLSKENQSIKIKKNDFEKVYAEAGEFNLLDLNIDGKEKERVIIKDIQKNPIKNTVTHVDFYRVDMKKVIEVEVPLNFINVPDAVKKLGGVLLKNIEILRAKCLPGDLLESIDVDLSALKDFKDSIRVKDLKVPASIEIIDDMETLVANVSEMRAEETKSEQETETKEGDVSTGSAQENKGDENNGGGEKKEEKK
ncbi:hypothetical protein A2331_04230 [Candidatus Falkowbacteria bacterium RIFOXYB2_FULL_34_18]|uniref:Large ribosomal subunit protein bL25 n=1 Tax=Candidatus Falkowbacteria bacterium RIFOXYD2_FULL_34_120 TaxID=1798007 RepID=A0A1F5TNB4_9BACT|nr:MAG: hypothetical protein A2500_00025 [Candidatus Falkowbacteria bacterium RIFOXYC12_FULL_34_55]OGF28834.1 MAG: hypothetical protein A2331_04230 [Candidatus Falkowbacteria bacterium RIFOXYB2_FULL_34_18]OGF38386.1 MAG: hypothetical protein A2515_06540 [Candidatus Falkowbacteria bacterium RIFOXYD12_FULL_34_57]OGF40376.1 MAG: hypothetical protein A2531_00145 [Candidatus Falkowbacteria bacterium RIFOXYD2_FULL_34_120]